MTEESKNNWTAKFNRACSSVLPIAKNRVGACNDCGACCMLPTPCPFLRWKDDGKSYCKIYLVRPPNCRKYPRTEKEFITKDVCGYKFV